MKPRPGYKNPLDLPEAKDRRNPRCYGLPNPKTPFPDYLALDGTQDDLWWKNPDDPNGGGGNRGRALSNVFVDTGSLTPEEQLKSVLGPLTQTRSDELSDVSELMFGPLLSDGSVVTIK
ncbi:hypothetical protein G3I24_43405 [Micromonospora aurantiaca]|nr:hypothetical protein [Micromonospora aurantiaca]